MENKLGVAVSEWSIGQRLKYLRKQQKESQAVFASHIGISQGNLSDMEKEKYLPSIHTILSIIEYYGFAADWLLLGLGPMRALHYDGDIPVVDSAVGGDGRLCEDERELLKTYRQLAVDGKAIVKSACYQEQRRLKAKLLRKAAME